MHIPDGFLSTPVWASLDLAAVPAVGYFARKARSDIEESRIPLLGVMGAFVFAAQMINFPVGLGTSGHLLGGALLACLLGPASAAIVMTAILVIQALVFQDGGILALGANVLNMAVIGVLAGYLPYRLFGAGRRKKLALFAGGLLSVMASALAALAQLAVSGVPIRPSLAGVSLVLFFVSGVVEGVITVAVAQAVENLNPGWLARAEASWKPGVAFFGGLAIALASLGVLIASQAPDGIGKILEQVGIASHPAGLLAAPLAGYEVSWLPGGWLRKAMAGLAGLVAAGLACLALGRFLARRRSA